MLQFITPLSLLTALTLLIPIAVHLWSRRRGKTIKVGSIRFMHASESRRFKSVRLHDIPLLLLRLALIALLLVMLSKPVWVRDVTESNRPGWILVGLDLLTRGLEAETVHHIDSLQALGNELHLLSTGFPQFTLDDPLPETHARDNHWSLLREAAQTIPQAGPLWVFTTNRLSLLRGERPTVQNLADWQVSGIPAENCWIEEARYVNEDSLLVTVGVSHSTGTSFERSVFKKPNSRTIIPVGGTALEFIPAEKDAPAMIHLLHRDALDLDNRADIAGQVDSLKMAVLYAPTREEDARYLAVALQAIIEFRRLNVSFKVESITAGRNVPVVLDWLFWLSPQPVPGDVSQAIASGMRVFRDAEGREYREVRSWLRTGSRDRARMIALKRVVESSGEGVALWKDGFGAPLLEFQRIGSGGYFDFHSRFHPQWNGLVLSDTFPEAMLRILQRELSETKMASPGDFSDQRMISSSQIMPVKSTGQDDSSPHQTRPDLSLPVWLIAAALFVFERFISERKIVPTKHANNTKKD